LLDCHAARHKTQPLSVAMYSMLLLTRQLIIKISVRKHICKLCS